MPSPPDRVRNAPRVPRPSTATKAARAGVAQAWRKVTVRPDPIELDSAELEDLFEMDDEPTIPSAPKMEVDVDVDVSEMQGLRPAGSGWWLAAHAALTKWFGAG